MKKSTSQRKFKDREQLVESYRKQLAEYGIELVIQTQQKLVYKETRAMKFLTVLEVAQELRISKETVYRYLQGGVLPGNKFGHKSWRIEADELKEFLDKHHSQRRKSKGNYWTLKKQFRKYLTREERNASRAIQQRA